MNEETNTLLERKHVPYKETWGNAYPMSIGWDMIVPCKGYCKSGRLGPGMFFVCRKAERCSNWTHAHTHTHTQLNTFCVGGRFYRTRSNCCRKRFWWCVGWLVRNVFFFWNKWDNYNLILVRWTLHVETIHLIPIVSQSCDAKVLKRLVVGYDSSKFQSRGNLWGWLFFVGRVEHVSISSTVSTFCFHETGNQELS